MWTVLRIFTVSSSPCWTVACSVLFPAITSYWCRPPDPSHSHSDPVQLLRGPLRLQPLPHSRTQVQLRVVRRRSPRQLLVLRLLRRTCAGNLPRPSHPLSTSLCHLKGSEVEDPESRCDKETVSLTSTDRASHWPAGRRHHAHHLRLQLGPEAGGHPALGDSG